MFSNAGWCVHRVDSKLLEEVQEYDAVPSEAASYGKNAFWDERYAADEEVSPEMAIFSLTTMLCTYRLGGFDLNLSRGCVCGHANRGENRKHFCRLQVSISRLQAAATAAAIYCTV